MQPRPVGIPEQKRGTNTSGEVNGKHLATSQETSLSQDAGLEPTHYHHQGNKHIDHFQRFSCVPLCFVCFIEIKFKMQSTLLTNFSVCNAILLTGGGSNFLLNSIHRPRYQQTISCQQTKLCSVCFRFKQSFLLSEQAPSSPITSARRISQVPKRSIWLKTQAANLPVIVTLF